MVPARRPRPRDLQLVAPTVLLTGFDAFGGERLNPSWLAAQALHGRRIAGHRIVAAQLPTVFDASLGMLRALLRRHRPMLVICLGQAGGRSAISLERVAININDARISDNAAAQPIDTPVVADGPAAYFTTLPIKAMRHALQQQGLAAEVSQTAGTFVCNHVFYGLMHELATRRGFRRTRGGFIHVPWLPEQGSPSMTLDQLVQGLKVAVRCALTTRHDLALGAGTVS
ncbi:MAG: pyroglutamyl-peptidase I [Burkholderiaceae bacterium]